jgi:hypothetical protein
LEKALEMIGYEDFRKSQLESRKQGVRLGARKKGQNAGTKVIAKHMKVTDRKRLDVIYDAR